MERQHNGCEKPGRRFAIGPLQRQQRGQAAVFVYLFLSVLIVVLLGLYKAGKLTSDKMELQNAADAAAYSVSVIEARDLNFASYMNRAIVANEVAVGQMVGLASFAFHFKSFHDYLNRYARPLNATPLAPLGVALGTMAQGFRQGGDGFIKVLKPAANKVSTGVHRINRLYGVSERGFHLASTFYALSSLQAMIDENGPPGARLSEFGLLTLMGHLATYGALPVPVPGDNNKFTQSYDPTEEDTADEIKAGGYGRLAAIIHDSADPFVNERGLGFDLFHELNKVTPFPDLYTGKGDEGWLGLEFDEKISIGLAEAKVSARLQINIALTRAGGSELRLIAPLDGNAPEDEASGQHFNWSAADTTDLGLGLSFGISAGARFCWPVVKCTKSGCTTKLKCTGWISLPGVNFQAVNNRLVARVKIKYKPLKIDRTWTLLNIPFPTEAPFGAGFAQAGSPGNFIASEQAHIGTESLGGPLPGDAYGGAADSLLAWNYPCPPGVFHQAGSDERKVGRKYGGLPTYFDTAGEDEDPPLRGAGGSNLLVGVVLDETDFDETNPARGGSSQKAVEPTGRFEITEKMASNQLHAIAKSEVYFKRPTDLTYFHRLDGQEEYGSTFNPYWNARLVETSHAERVAALALQQRVYMGSEFKPAAVLSSVSEPFMEKFRPTP